MMIRRCLAGVPASEQRHWWANQTALIERAVLVEAPLSAVGTAGRRV